MTLIIALLTLLLVASLAGQWYLWRELKALQRQEKTRDQQIQRLSDDFAALCHASAGAGDRVVELEQQLRRIVDRQDQWELRAGGERSYPQAIQMVHKGADADALVANCGLTRGEAELIVMLHGMSKAS